MILNLLTAVPAYRSEVHDLLIDAFANLRIASMMSEALAGRAPQDRLLLPSAKPTAFHWLGRARANSCDLGFNRNMFVQAALDMRAHWLLMCDADTYQLDPEPVLRMLHDGWAKDAAVIAAPVMRRDGWLNCLGFDGDTPLNRKQVGGKIEPVRRVGTAFMAVNIPWLARNWPWDDADPWFAFKPATKGGKPHHISEDFGFCDGIARHGGAVLLDGRYEPSHEGAPPVEHNAAA